MVFIVVWIMKHLDKYKLQENQHRCKSFFFYAFIKIDKIIHVFTYITFRIPPNSLTSETHYEKMLEMFGRKGHFCTTVQDIQRALRICLQVNIICIFHLILITVSSFNE